MSKTFLAVSLAGLVATGGCASVQAKSKPADRPALSVPPAPERIIEAAVEPPEPVNDLPAPSGAPSTAAPPRAGRTPAPRPEPPKADPKPPDPKPVEPAPVEPVPSVPNPPALLRTPETADASGAARGVQATIDRARGLLNSVNFGPLSNDRKQAYNDAKLLIQQAEDSLKRGNLGIAQGYANKAETLAKELAGK